MSFETLIDETLPSVFSKDLYPYFKHRLIPARVAECYNVPRPAANTFYVDADIGSSGAGTTPATAFKLISDVNTALTNGTIPNYSTILFRTGKVWYTGVPLEINGKTGIRIGNYMGGSDNVYTLPLISFFNQTGTWTSNADEGSTSDGIPTYYTSLSNEPSWLQEFTNDATKFAPIRYRASLANCQATSRSWTWVGGGTDRLYVHPQGTLADGAGVSSTSLTVDSVANLYIGQVIIIGSASAVSISNINYSTKVVTLQAARSWSDNDVVVASPANVYRWGLQSDAAALEAGIELNNVDLFYMSGIRVEGAGCCAITPQVGYLVACQTGTIGRVVIEDCEFYYGGNHLAGSFGGGILTFRRIKGGFCAHSSGSTSFVMYHQDAVEADEVLFDDIEVIGGHLPHDSANSALPTANGSSVGATGFYGHNGTSGEIGLAVVIDCKEPDPLGYTNATATIGNTSMANIKTGRQLWINHSIPRRSDLVQLVTSSNGYYINCYLSRWLTTSTGNATTFTSDTAGTFVNCIFDLMCYAGGFQRSALRQTNNLKFHNCSWHLNGAGAGLWYFYLLSTATTGMRVENSVIARTGTRQVLCSPTANFTADNSVFDNIATYGISQGTTQTGWGNVTQKILTYPLLAGKSPENTIAETGCTGSNVPEYDFYNRRRPETVADRSLGPVEANPVFSQTFDNLDVYANVIFDDRTRRTLAVSLGSKVKADQVVAKLSSPATLNAEELAALQAAVGNATVAAIVADTIAP